MAELRILKSAAERKRRIPCQSERFVIGRRSTNDLMLLDEMASRHHAAIVRDAAGVHHLEDLGSENGTLLNGESVTRAELHDGDVIGIGRTEILFDDREAKELEAGAEGHAPHAAETRVTVRFAVDSAGDGTPKRVPTDLRGDGQPPTSGRRGDITASNNESMQAARRRWAMLGIGRVGDLLVSQFCRYGHDRVALAIEGLVPGNRLRTPKKFRVRIAEDGAVQDIGAEVAGVAEAVLERLSLDPLQRTDLFLVGEASAFGAAGDPVSHVMTIRDALGLDADSLIRTHAILYADPGSEMASGWTTLRTMGTVGSVFLVDAEVVRHFGGGTPLRDRPIATTVAGGFDLLATLVSRRAVEGTFGVSELNRLLDASGFGVLGIAATRAVDDSSLAGAARLALTRGVLYPHINRSIARRAAFCAVIGTELLASFEDLPDRALRVLEDLVSEAPWAEARTAVLTDDGPSVRFVVAFTGIDASA